jgi:hypothetical protein
MMIAPIVVMVVMRTLNAKSPCPIYVHQLEACAPIDTTHKYQSSREGWIQGIIVWTRGLLGLALVIPQRLMLQRDCKGHDDNDTEEGLIYFDVKHLDAMLPNSMGKVVREM